MLVVDDEPKFPELYSLWLADTYDVVTATSGEAALEALDAEVDVVLLDRRMPGLSGADVVEEIRRRGIDCKVVMVTAVEPDIDIADMPFDEYLVKPVTEDDLRAVIESMLERSTYDAEVQDYFALASRLAALESTLNPQELERSSAYEDLKRRVKESADDADDALKELLDDDEAAGLRELVEDRENHH